MPSHSFNKRSIFTTFPQILVMCMFCSGIAGQDVMPGGVIDPTVWLCVERDSGAIFLADPRKASIPNTRYIKQNLHTLIHFNYNPAMRVNAETGPLHLNLQQSSNQLSVFMVYAAANVQKEFALWTYNSEDTSAIVSTTHRAATFPGNTYNNHEGKRTGSTMIHSYIHRTESTSASSGIEFFTTPVELHLPVERLNGAIAEIIVYDRALSSDERLRIETYLAIKYGVSLEQSSVTLYLNSRSDIIWNKEESAPYLYRITGLGKDAISGLEQNQAIGNKEDKLLSISMGAHEKWNAQNASNLNNLDYLIWSDNNEALDPGSDVSPGPAPLQRKWLIKSTGYFDSIQSELRLNANVLPITDDYTSMWLQLIRAPQYRGFKAEYIKGVLNHKGEYIFSDIRWDTDHSGSDVFTFVPGPDFIPVIEYRRPFCNPEEDGTLKIGAAGGQSPYSFTLINTNSGVAAQGTFEGFSDKILLKTGNYTLTLTDRNGLIYEETFVVSHENGPQICLDDVLFQRHGSELIVDARKNCPPCNFCTYQWTTPSGAVQLGPVINAKKPGHYLLEVDEKGCVAHHGVMVVDLDDDIFSLVEVFPNPIGPGSQYQLRVVLNTISALKYRLYNINGKLIQSGAKGPSDVFFIQEEAPVVPGTYTLQISAGSKNYAHKIIVQ